jgi:hypothetical protein
MSNFWQSLVVWAPLTLAACTPALATSTGEPAPKSSSTISLDGLGWLVAGDPKNLGREQKWWEGPTADAKPAKMPSIIQDVLPNYHGVAWYWCDFSAPASPHVGGRYLLRFWQVDYLADVWLNGVHVGQHEGAEEPFTLDVTDAVQSGATNRIAVRVLNPTNEPIDGFKLSETPHRNKTYPISAGSDYNYGGITDSVDFIVSSAVRVEDLFVHGDCGTGEVRIGAVIRNAGKTPVTAKLAFAVAPAASGAALATVELERDFPPGDQEVDITTHVPDRHLWNLNDPCLYRITARVTDAKSGDSDESSTRFGFRDFRFADGAFRLNGKRIFLRCSHTGNESPVGFRAPQDPDLLRRDIMNCKVMGFNAVRFFCAAPRRYQLDLCDEIGLLVYEETFAGWMLADSPKMTERLDATIRGAIRRDRNHPSVVMWGLLNEMTEGPVFRHAVGMLPLVHALDDTRLVMLDSGLDIEWMFPWKKDPKRTFGALCNPGSKAWEDVLSDIHPYQRIPHLPDQIHALRDNSHGLHLRENGKELPVFISEYGAASALDLPRLARHFEQIGRTDSEEALFYRGLLDRFTADWQRWEMADTFGSPEEYFRQCVAKMAKLRSIGLDAIRANPLGVGYSMTGLYDHGFCGEGATATEFRDLKPGATDALFDGFYPLRLCLFTEPYHVYRGGKIRLDASLANEDAMPPGEYPVRLQVIDPNSRTIFDKTITVTIRDPNTKPQPPLAFPFFGEDVVIDGPTGSYRFLAAFQKGGAAMGGKAEFFVTDPADMPSITKEIVLWGDDPSLAKWLSDHGILIKPFEVDRQSGREVILVGTKPAAGDAAAWLALAQHIARGSTAIFLSADVFRKGDNAVGWAPLENKGNIAKGIIGNDQEWLYIHDQWTKRHPIFDGLPSGGIMDCNYYREIITSARWEGIAPPAEVVAAGINTSFGYSSGTYMTTHRLGAGQFVLNLLNIHGQLGKDPVAERLLRNLLRFAAKDAAQPLADLPADFQGQLKAMGY